MAGVIGIAASTAGAQLTEYKLDEAGAWRKTAEPAPGTDEAIIDQARKLIAENRPREAVRLLNRFIEERERTDNPWLAEAYLIRGDAKVAHDDEYEALYDYEVVTRQYPGTPAFPIAVAREYEIASRYVRGYRKKWWFGWRVADASELGADILIYCGERLPNSRVAELAILDLADYYYRERELRLASEAYDIFLKLFPDSEHRQRALQRRVYANVARFKGPQYDASGLKEAREFVNDLIAKYPADAERAGLGDALLARLDQSAAAQMYETAEWYLKRSDRVAARRTLKSLLARHPGSVAAARAVETLEVIEKELGLRRETAARPAEVSE